MKYSSIQGAHDRSLGAEELLLVLFFAILAAASGPTSDRLWLKTGLHLSRNSLTGEPAAGTLRLNLTLEDAVYVQLGEEPALRVEGDWCHADFEQRVYDAVRAAAGDRPGPFETAIGADRSTPICAFMEIQEAFEALHDDGVAENRLHLVARPAPKESR